VRVRSSSVTLAPAAISKIRSPSPLASIVVVPAPTPLITSPATLDAMSRSPVVLSSGPAGLIDSVYVPAPSVIVFPTACAAAQPPLGVSGAFTDAIADRSEHPEVTPSLVVPTAIVFALAAGATDSHADAAAIETTAAVNRRCPVLLTLEIFAPANPGAKGYAAAAVSSTMSRVRDGSTLMPGPIVDANVTDRM
jgi:hypothetical protein